MDLSQRWGEDAGQDGLTGAVNAALWSRSMGARFPADWWEKHIKVNLPAIAGTASLIEAQVAVSSAISKGELDTEGGAVWRNCWPILDRL